MTGAVSIVIQLKLVGMTDTFAMCYATKVGCKGTHSNPMICNWDRLGRQTHLPMAILPQLVREIDRVTNYCITTTNLDD